MNTLFHRIKVFVRIRLCNIIRNKIGVLSLIDLLLIAILAMNIYAMGLFYYDKQLAVKGQSHKRISEKQLLQVTFLLGGIGALLGMQTFRHKTKHLKFQILVPLSALITAAVVSYLLNQ